jgi:hypothetical protein
MSKVFDSTLFVSKILEWIRPEIPMKKDNGSDDQTSKPERKSIHE